MWIDFIALVVGFLITELVYFRLADRFNIVDKPNERSSHQSLTIRGGGIIFPLAVLISQPFSHNYNWVIFAVSLSIIAIVSFIDDIRSLDSKLRLAVHGIAVAGLLYPFSGQVSWYILGICFIIIIGIINAYNFMDGINGITLLYSGVTIACLYWVSDQVFFLQGDFFFHSILASLLVFSFFNLRRKAKCFAGDIGSVSMAFIICYLLSTLIIGTGTVCWLFFLAVYGIDTVFTICCRILRKEPLMQAHRSHFYQHLVNERKYSHLQVSCGYALAQLFINIIIILSYNHNQASFAVVTLVAFLLIYLIFRFRLEGKYRLFTAY